MELTRAERDIRADFAAFAGRAAIRAAANVGGIGSSGQGVGRRWSLSNGPRPEANHPQSDSAGGILAGQGRVPLPFIRVTRRHSLVDDNERPQQSISDMGRVSHRCEVVPESPEIPLSPESRRNGLDDESVKISCSAGNAGDEAREIGCEEVDDSDFRGSSAGEDSVDGASGDSDYTDSAGSAGSDSINFEEERLARKVAQEVVNQVSSATGTG
jgi:hypothetical protein